jgi:uncharacterized membrane protein YgcG
MRRRLPLAAAVVAVLAVAATPSRARACGANETQVYASKTSVWCVDNGIVQKYGAFPSAYFAYGDGVISELVALFNVPAQGVYTFEAGPNTGGAHTGSECCGLGVTVTGDAFYGNAYNVTGFWGYLLSLHETINDWTGQVSGGWPTDFWADHVSAFPNSMDWQIMAELGAKNKDANLQAAAVAQKARFYPNGDSVDARVPMFDGIFALPNMGFTGYSHVFGYVEKDMLSWDAVAVNGNNPDQRRTEYVIAYLSLGPGKSLLPTMQAANVANGQPDGAGDAGYTAQQANVDAIATAHCSIAAAAAGGSDETADLAALRAGNYAGVKAHGPCGSGCPAECGCKSSANLCVAPWLGDAPAIDAGVPDAAAGGGNGGGVGGGGAGSGGGGGNGATGGTHAAGCGCQLGAAGGDGGAAIWIVSAIFAALGLARLRRRR